MLQTYINNVYSFCVNKRPQILQLWRLVYLLQFVYTCFMIFLRVTKNPLYASLYPTARMSGNIAVALFLLVMIPGIARRFGIKHKLISLLMIYRRYTGIAMFLFVLIHAFIIRFIPMIAGYVPPFPRPFFEIAGFIAFLFLMPLFITSNDRSVKFLKQKWYVLHRVVYVIMWLIAFHLLFQGVSVTGVISLCIITGTVGGKIYQTIQKKKS